MASGDEVQTLLVGVCYVSYHLTLTQWDSLCGRSSEKICLWKDKYSKWVENPSAFLQLSCRRQKHTWSLSFCTFSGVLLALNQVSKGHSFLICFLKWRSPLSGKGLHASDDRFPSQGFQMWKQMLTALGFLPQRSKGRRHVSLTLWGYTSAQSFLWAPDILLWQQWCALCVSVFLSFH